MEPQILNYENYDNFLSDINMLLKSDDLGILKLNHNLARYTSWRVGGNAKLYFRPKNLLALSKFVSKLPKKEEVLFLGLGSNLLIRDGGFNGIVIHIFKTLDEIEISCETKNIKEIKIEAGVTCAKIAKFCAKNGLLGGEFFSGIPGTMGGALAMNAGAFGSETWKYVTKVDVINRKGEIITRDKSEFDIAYRSVINKTIREDEWFVRGYLSFEKSNVNSRHSRNLSLEQSKSDKNTDFINQSLGSEKIKQLLRQRNNSQPIGELSCGSVFKNPEGYYAAKLIEASKLKGERVGNAMVSTKHANFIINLGNAKSSDIEDLINFVKQKVLQDHGIELHREVRIVGFEGDK